MSILTYAGVTPAMKAALEQEAATAGIMIPSTSGHIESHGCRFSYSYDQGHQAITVTLLAKPWLYPEALVMGQLDAAFRQALGRLGWTGA